MKNVIEVKEETPPNYEDVRIKRFPIAVQCWTFRKFTFFETLEKVEELGIKYLQAYPGQKLGIEGSDVGFYHNMSREHRRIVKAKLKEHGIQLIAYGVVGFENTEEAVKEVFDFANDMGIRTIVTEPDYDDFSLIEKYARQNWKNVAIHNHPLPTKYARPETVLNTVKDLNERVGSCSDTGHWLRTGIVPTDALKMLKGRIRDVHLKDLDDDMQDVPFGQGNANIRDILAELTIQNYGGFLTVEHEKEADAMNPLPAIREGLDYIKSVTYYQEYEELLGFWDSRYNKHGWNHYGPGYFELDEKTGIMTSQKGMGLTWYSKKKLKDFVLELEFRVDKLSNNSGIFYRIPEFVISEDYIYHAFEIQIDGATTGKHMTGAIYDAVAPAEYEMKAAGEWNHYKITVIADKIRVILNGKELIHWIMEPRGKIGDFALEGYIGLQNHDSGSPVQFRNIFVKEL